MSIQNASPKLKLLIPRLASDNDGEIVSTVYAIKRLLSKNDCDFHDLAKSIGVASKYRSGGQKHTSKHNYNDVRGGGPDWSMVAAFCVSNIDRLGERESDFVVSVSDSIEDWGSPTEKQAKWLRDIFLRLGGGRDDAGF